MTAKASMVPVKGEPGVFFNRLTGKKLHIVDWREDDKYDSVFLPAGRINPGTAKAFFRDLEGKELIDTNFSTPRRLPAGEEMILDRIGVQIPMSYGNVLVPPEEIKTVAENAYLVFKINRKDVAEGPLLKFPSGYGMSGMTNTPSDGVLSIGVPSTAAAAKLVREQSITSDHEVEGVIQFFDRQWLGRAATTDPDRPFDAPALRVGVVVRLLLHGLIKAAATK